jgi:hypothetical protein
MLGVTGVDDLAETTSGKRSSLVGIRQECASWNKSDQVKNLIHNSVAHQGILFRLRTGCSTTALCFQLVRGARRCEDEAGTPWARTFILATSSLSEGLLSLQSTRFAWLGNCKVWAIGFGLNNGRQDAP